MKKIFAILAIISGLAFSWQITQAQDVFACFPTLKRCLFYYQSLENCQTNLAKFYKDATNKNCYTNQKECQLACADNNGGSNPNLKFWVCELKTGKLIEHPDSAQYNYSDMPRITCSQELQPKYNGIYGQYDRCQCYTEEDAKKNNWVCPVECVNGEPQEEFFSCQINKTCTKITSKNIQTCRSNSISNVCTKFSDDPTGMSCQSLCEKSIPPGGGGNPPGGGGGGGTTPPIEIVLTCNSEKKCVKEEIAGGVSACETKYGAGKCFKSDQEKDCQASCIPAQQTYKMWGCLADGCEELGEYTDPIKCQEINKDKFLQAGGKCFTLEQKDTCEKNCIDKTKTTQNVLIIGNTQDKKEGWSFSSGRVYFKSASEDSVRYFPIDLPEFKKYKFSYIDIGNILNEFNYDRLSKYDTIISLASHHVPIMAKDNIRRLFKAWIENRGGKFVRLTNGEQALYNPVDLTLDDLVVERNFVKYKIGVEAKTPFGIVEDNWLSSKIGGYNFINLQKMEYLNANESGLSAKIWPRNEGWCADMTHMSEAGQYVQAYQYLGNGILIYNGIGLGSDFNKGSLAAKTDNLANNIVKIWTQALSLGWGDQTKNLPCTVKIAKQDIPVPQAMVPISDLSFNYNFSRCPLQTTSASTPNGEIKYNNKVKFCLNITKLDPSKTTKVMFSIYPVGFPDMGSSKTVIVTGLGQVCAEPFQDQTFGAKEAKAVIYTNDEVAETIKIAFNIRQDQENKTVNNCLAPTKK